MGLGSGSDEDTPFGTPRTASSKEVCDLLPRAAARGFKDAAAQASCVPVLLVLADTGSSGSDEDAPFSTPMVASSNGVFCPLPRAAVSASQDAGVQTCVLVPQGAGSGGLDRRPSLSLCVPARGCVSACGSGSGSDEDTQPMTSTAESSNGVFSPVLGRAVSASQDAAVQTCVLLSQGAGSGSLECASPEACEPAKEFKEVAIETCVPVLPVLADTGSGESDGDAPFSTPMVASSNGVFSPVLGRAVSASQDAGVQTCVLVSQGAGSGGLDRRPSLSLCVPARGCVSACGSGSGSDEDTQPMTPTAESSNGVFSPVLRRAMSASQDAAVQTCMLLSQGAGSGSLECASPEACEPAKEFKEVAIETCVPVLPVLVELESESLECASEAIECASTSGSASGSDAAVSELGDAFDAQANHEVALLHQDGEQSIACIDLMRACCDMPLNVYYIDLEQMLRALRFSPTKALLAREDGIAIVEESSQLPEFFDSNTRTNVGKKSIIILLPLPLCPADISKLMAEFARHNIEGCGSVNICSTALEQMLRRLRMPKASKSLKVMDASQLPDLFESRTPLKLCLDSKAAGSFYVQCGHPGFLLPLSYASRMSHLVMARLSQRLHQDVAWMLRCSDASLSRLVLIFMERHKLVKDRSMDLKQVLRGLRALVKKTA